jgi:hypothetical protein
MSRNETDSEFSMSSAKVSRVTAYPLHATPTNSDAPAKTASIALVPVVAAPRKPAPIAHGLTRPDPSFVTHLIAMAELSPQTRLLRRAAPEDVQAAYRSVANQNRTMNAPGLRMRHIA